MADQPQSDSLFRLVLVALGLGIVSIPFVGPRLSLRDAGSSGGPSAKACPSGVGTEPYCLAPRPPDSITSGSALLHQFYGRQSGSPLPDSLQCGPTLRVMIATVPDPAESRFANSFDAVVYALSRAHEAAGYGIERYWLPWTDGVAKDPGAARLLATQPGVLLFRRLRAPLTKADLSLTYLVGELPTSGVNKVMLQSALADIRRIRCHCGDSVLKIVGPYFSGSMPSLALALPPVTRTRYREVSLISGSATASSNRELDLVGLRPGGQRLLRFKATVHSDRDYQAALDATLAALNIRPWQLALLTEQATLYGRGSIQSPGRVLTIPFPMNIGTVRTALERAEAATATAGTGVNRITLNSTDLTRYRDVLPTLSPVTVATQEVFLDQIARVLMANRIRMVGLTATDTRDKLFLARELHRRLPQLLFFTYESDQLYLHDDAQSAMLGMIVFSTYPLTADRAPSGELNLFPNDAAFGVFNAALFQLGASSLVEYRTGLPQSDGETTLPPVWVTVVGAGSMQPLRTYTAPDSGYVQAAAGERERTPRQPRRPLLRGGMIALAALLLCRDPAWRLVNRAGRRRRELGRLLRVLRRSTRQPRGRSKRWSWRSLALWRVVNSLLARMITARQPSPKDDRHALQPFWAEASVFADLSRLALALALVPVSILLTTEPTALSGARPSSGVQWHDPNTVALIAAIPALINLLALIGDLAGVRLNYLQSWFRPHWRWAIPEIALRALILVLTICIVAWFARLTDAIIHLPSDGALRALFWQRARALESRTSPILPLVIVSLTVTFWCRWHRKRCRILAHQPVLERSILVQCVGRDSQFHQVWADLRKAIHEYRRDLSLLTPSGRALVVLGGVLFGAAILGNGAHPALDAIVLGSAYTNLHNLLWAGVIFGLGLTVISVDRLLTLWRGLREMLQALERLPLRVAFERLPPHVDRITSLVPSRSPWQVWRAWQDQRWEHLRNLALAADTDPPVSWSEPRQLAERLLNTPSGERFKRLEGELRAHWLREPDLSVLTDIAPVTKELRELRDGRAAAEMDTATVSSKLRRSAGNGMRIWMRAAEEYLAADIVDYVDWAINVIRWIAIFLVGALVALTALLFSYPMTQDRMVNLTYLAVFLGTIGVLGWLITSMSRNDALSRITGTAPGRLTWDRSLITNLTLLVGVPLIGFLSANLPEVRGALAGLIGPASHALGR